MLRKMLIALMAVAALGVGSTAMARGGGGSHGGNFAGGHGASFGVGGVARAPMVSGRIQGFSGRNFNRNSFAFNGGFRDHRHHHRFHNRNIFAVGFAGPYFDDYGYYDGCWRRVRTYYGWRWADVCGGDPYWGY